jgi:hypothetical protein
MPKNSMAGVQAEWEKLLAGVEANRSELAHVEVFSAQLDAQLNDLRAELARRSAMQADVLQSSRTIQESLRTGRDLARRIGYSLKARYGSRSDKLVEFGLKPPRKHRPGRSGSDLRKEESGAPWNPTVPFK